MRKKQCISYGFFLIILLVLVFIVNNYKNLHKVKPNEYIQAIQHDNGGDKFLLNKPLSAQEFGNSKSLKEINNRNEIIIEQPLKDEVDSNARPANSPVLPRPKEWSIDGLGELGVPVTLNLEPAEMVEMRQLMDRYGINLYLSDRISPHRMLRDSRHEL